MQTTARPRPEPFPTATREGERWIDADGTKWWACASGQRFIWQNRPPGTMFPPEHPVYDVIERLHELKESGRAAA